MTEEAARKKSKPIRHPWADYEYVIYPIFTISNVDHQVYVEDNPFFSSAERLPTWVDHFESEAQPSVSGVMKTWAKDYWLFTLVAAPASLVMLGLGMAGQKQLASEQRQRTERLALLSEFPMFRRDI